MLHVCFDVNQYTNIGYFTCFIPTVRAIVLDSIISLNLLKNNYIVDYLLHRYLQSQLNTCIQDLVSFRLLFSIKCSFNGGFKLFRFSKSLDNHRGLLTHSHKKKNNNNPCFNSKTLPQTNSSINRNLSTTREVLLHFCFTLNKNLASGWLLLSTDCTEC